MMATQAPSVDRPRTVTILGATGSVGTSCLRVIGANRDLFRIEALVAARQVETLARAAREFAARRAVVADPGLYGSLREALSGSGIEIAAGPAAVLEAAAGPADLVVSAIVGAAGLAPTLAALEQGRLVALANKESLVCAGELMIDAARRGGAVLLPADSEHNAVFQALAGHDRAAVEKIILTASGGPFRELDPARMADVTVEQALRHPNWSMGAKITIDSATMMNKGLEIIEAHHLFGQPEERIEVVVHPQSIVHSLVAFSDGAQLAQLGVPDMRVPLAYCLAWPGRVPVEGGRLDLTRIGRLDFLPPDPARFPALRLARRALRAGGTAPTILNAANEVAVEAFIGGRIGFLDIAGAVEDVLGRVPAMAPGSIEDIFGCDAEARRVARVTVGERAAGRA